MKSYRYFNKKTNGVDIDGMLEDLRQASAGSVVLLHGCAHNPTGSDPSPEEWQKVLEVVKAQNLIPFFDNAYQGFASGSLEQDAYSVQLFVEAGVDMLISQSYAKNMGMYSGRVGALSVVCATPEPVEAVRSQLKGIIRAMYSNPPVHGAKVAAKIMTRPRGICGVGEGTCHHVRQNPAHEGAAEGDFGEAGYAGNLGPHYVADWYVQFHRHFGQAGRLHSGEL